jgi:hypothetical protein
VLVDNTVRSALMSFMDGFSRYNQILMAPKDMLKTTFVTEWGIYCYTIMPFGLKNVGATYQRMGTALLHDMMHKEEVYIDDMIIKSVTRGEHITNLRKFFERIKKYKLRLNPNKCTFGVTDQGGLDQDQSHTRDATAQDRKGNKRIPGQITIYQ